MRVRADDHHGSRNEPVLLVTGRSRGHEQADRKSSVRSCGRRPLTAGRRAGCRDQGGPERRDTVGPMRLVVRAHGTPLEDEGRSSTDLRTGGRLARRPTSKKLAA